MSTDLAEAPPISVGKAHHLTRLKYVFLVLGVVFNVTGQLSTKQAALSGSGGAHTSFISPWFLAGIASMGISMQLWVLLLRKMPMTQAHPITTGCCLALVASASHLLWAEPMPVTRIVGIAIIMAGVVLVARGMR